MPKKNDYDYDYDYDYDVLVGGLLVPERTLSGCDLRKTNCSPLVPVGYSDLLFDNLLSDI